MGNGNKAEMLIAVCAVLTSAIAVFIAWDQGRVMRAQQHGAVYPVVQLEGFVSSSAETTSMGLRLSNSGVGPALIERVDMLKEGEAIDSLGPYVAQFPPGYEQSWSSLIGRAIAPGDEVIPLRVDWPRDMVSADERNAAAAAWSELDVEICYCSVFNRCWTTQGLGMGVSMTRAERADSCERSETDIFEAVANQARAPRTEPTPEVE
ncbi:hypothetical protein [Henriciella marina]|uniref:hypothetical protein n=1 Tax=Henriciella marina TaxID=453851 RepID=UPI0003792815|nr:hypothetical protein [Henriciella marina]